MQRHYTDRNLSSSGVDAAMPVKKVPPHKTLVRNLIASKKLKPAEQTAFEKLADKFTPTYELNTHEKLWVEALNTKYLAKKN
jgi:hypothetical protein